MSSRGTLVAALTGLWLAALGARLYWLQVVRHDHYAAKAAAQHQRVLDLEPPRGTIYDARGRVLAVSVDVDSVFADPSEIRDPAGTASKLAAVLDDVDAKELAQRLAGERDFVFVARKLDPPVADAVKKLDLAGIHFLRESKRYYPMRELGAQVLGFVGTDHRGLAGLEAHYDRVIAGRAGRRTVLRDAHRRTLLSPRLEYVEAKPGADLHLTLDATIQYVVEKELLAAVEKFHAKGGTAIVADPQTGAILGIATVPGFDANRFGEVSSDHWRVGAVTDAYEPGSTFKMVTAAAVLAHGLLTPDDVLDCEMGGITLAGVLIHDHKPYGRLTVRDILAKSSNVGMIKLALLLGDERLYDEVRALGFGERTGVDLPGESPGIVRPLRSWSVLSKAYVSFGQEVSVTPLQLVRAMAAVANRGRLMRPHVVDTVVSERGREDVGAPFEQGRALDPAVAAQLEQLLANVVTNGTGTQAAIAGYPVAGKTGTAQKIVGGHYSHRYFVSSFLGYAPVGNPRLVALVSLDEPWPSYYGGQVAAPAFASIVRQVLLYWGVPPQPAPLAPRPEGIAPFAPGTVQLAAAHGSAASMSGLELENDESADEVLDTTTTASVPAVPSASVAPATGSISIVPATLPARAPVAAGARPVLAAPLPAAAVPVPPAPPARLRPASGAGAGAVH